MPDGAISPKPSTDRRNKASSSSAVLDPSLIPMISIFELGRRYAALDHYEDALQQADAPDLPGLTADIVHSVTSVAENVVSNEIAGLHEAMLVTVAGSDRDAFAQLFAVMREVDHVAVFTMDEDERCKRLKKVIHALAGIVQVFGANLDIPLATLDNGDFTGRTRLGHTWLKVPPPALVNPALYEAIDGSVAGQEITR